MCWAQSLTTSDIRDSATAVCQVLWRLVTDTGGLWWAWTGLDLPHRASESRHVAVATVHGRTCAFHCRGLYTICTILVSKNKSPSSFFIFQKSAKLAKPDLNKLNLQHRSTIGYTLSKSVLAEINNRPTDGCRDHGIVSTGMTTTGIKKVLDMGTWI